MKRAGIDFLRLSMIGGLIMALSGAMAFGELYTSWTSHRDYAMNPAGAGIATNLANFPVLIRLTGADSAVFKNATSPADLRFAKGANLDVSYQYQVERWDAADRLAEIWVLVDTVTASATSQKFRMYWGNATVPAASNGAAVFSSANGFVAVWHCADLTDATGNGYTLTNNNGAGLLPGVIDSGFTFDGSSQYLSVAGMMNSPAALTMSCWANVTGTTQQELVTIANSPTLESPVTGGNVLFYHDAAAEWPAFDNSASSVLSGRGWVYVAGVIDPNDSYEGYFLNGGVPSLGAPIANCGSNSSAIAYSQTPALTCLGWNASETTRYLSGSLNEVRIESVARSADWIKLCYENQQSGQTFVAPFIPPAAPSLAAPTNGKSVPLSALMLSWGTMAGATSYSLQISTSSAFGTFLVNETGLATASVSVVNLAVNSIYYWQVSAQNAAGTSAWSNVWSFTTVITSAGAGRDDLQGTEFTVQGGVLCYVTAAAERVEITFCDVRGRTALVLDRNPAAGRHVVDLRSYNLAAGCYLVNFRAEGAEKRAVMVMTR